jgi:hypothetical protein
MRILHEVTLVRRAALRAIPQQPDEKTAAFLMYASATPGEAGNSRSIQTLLNRDEAARPFFPMIKQHSTKDF